MRTKVVAYDLNNETQRPNIVKTVKDLGSWARLSESSYAVETSKSPKEILALLRKHLDADDNCYVITLTAPWYGWGPEEVLQWLRKRLGD